LLSPVTAKRLNGGPRLTLKRIQFSRTSYAPTHTHGPRPVAEGFSAPAGAAFGRLPV
jgi:hypothetical protein